MKKDIIDRHFESYQKGFDAGKKHDSPSEATINFLNAKIDKKTFWIVLSFVVGAIGNLYFAYYSGFAEIKTDVGIIMYQVEQSTVQIEKLTNQFEQLTK